MKRKWLLLSLLLLVGFTPLLAGCATIGNMIGGGDFPLTIKDSFDRQVTIPEVPEKIVSLAPSNTEILFALGLGDKVIGVTDVCNYPEEALQIEKMGGFQGPNLERIVAAQPDLILADSLTGKDSVEQLTNAGLPVVVIQSDNMDQLFSNIRLVGQATASEQAADELVAGLQARLQAVTTKVATLSEEEKLRVFYEVWTDGMSAGPNTMLAGIIAAAGGINVTNDATTDWPVVSLEALIAKNPQVIILAHSAETPGQVEARATWKTMDAIKNKRVYAPNPDIWNRPGPRVVDAIEELAETLYPNLFEK